MRKIKDPILSEEKTKAVAEAFMGLTYYQWVIIRQSIDNLFDLSAAKLMLDNSDTISEDLRWMAEKVMEEGFECDLDNKRE